MSKRKHITLNEIRNALKDSAFNPNEKHPLSVIADVRNTQYYVRRAMEMLNVVLEEQISPCGEIGVIQDQLRDAISLLALARVEHAKNEDNSKNGS